MDEPMTPRNRIAAAVAGKVVDRPPVSFWGHAYDRESNAEDLAAVTIDAWERYRWDFVKLNPRASYHGEAWGLRTRYPGARHEKPQTVTVPVKRIEDWDTIRPLGPEAAPFAEQIQAVRLVRKALDPEVPLIETVFTPLAVASYLAGSPDVVRAHLREDERRVRKAVEAIRNTLRPYVGEILRAGADGIFFATVDWATRDRLAAEEYARIARQDDLDILSAVQSAHFNVLHVCRKNNLLEHLADYPVHAFSWAATEPGNPSLGEALGFIRGAAVGGIGQADALQSPGPEMVLAQVLEGWKQTGGLRWMVAPGCSIPPTTPAENLEAVREAVEALAGEGE
jgi:uroporphyrinogen decarboxylase